MSKTVLVFPFVVDDETNLQVFLHREVVLPQPLPDRLYLGQLPAEARVLTSQLLLFGRFAHTRKGDKSWPPLTRGPVYDLENDTNYVILEDGREPDKRIPFLLAQGWSNELLPVWLLEVISKPRRDPYQPVPDM